MTGKSPSLRSLSSPPEFEFRRGNKSGDDTSAMNVVPVEAPDETFQAAVDADEKSDSAIMNNMIHYTDGRHSRATSTSLRSGRSSEDRKAQSLFAKAVFELPPVLKVLTSTNARIMLLNHYADQFEELGHAELMEEVLKVVEMTESVSPSRDAEYVRHLEESSKEKGCESLDIERMKIDKSYYTMWRSQKEQEDVEEAKRISITEMKKPVIETPGGDRRLYLMPEFLTKTPNSRIVRRTLDLEGDFRKPSSQLIDGGYLSGKINRVMPVQVGDEETDRKLISENAKNIVRAKTRPPERWNGEGEFDDYQDWVFHLDHYFKVIEFPKEYQVAEMSQFLSGKARSWFMRVVAKNAARWTVEKVNEALFDAFFPANLRSQFRHEFLTATQGAMHFKEFAEHIKNLASRLPNVDERDAAIRLWHGAQPYLRVKWAEAGFNEEISDLEDLV